MKFKRITKPCANVFVLVVLTLPSTVFSQDIGVKEMLTLQKSALLHIEDEIETKSWKFNKIITFKEADSLVFNFNISHYIDSLKTSVAAGKTNITDSFYAQLLNTNLDDPAWLEYQYNNATEDDSAYINTIDVKLPKFYALAALNLKLQSFEKHRFQQSLALNFKEDSIYRNVLGEIRALHIPDATQYVKFEHPFITKVYKLPTQVIVLTTVTSPERFYSLEVFSRSDYDFLNHAEIELKGKVDFIH